MSQSRMAYQEIDYYETIGVRKSAKCSPRSTQEGINTAVRMFQTQFNNLM